MAAAAILEIEVRAYKMGNYNPDFDENWYTD
jgi:hypothetical protein